MLFFNQQFAVVFLVTLQFDLGHCARGNSVLGNIILKSRRQNILHLPGKDAQSSSSDAGSLVIQILESHMNGCHKTLAKEGDDSPLFEAILRALDAVYCPHFIAELMTEPTDTEDNYFQRMKRGEEKVTCKAFVFDLTTSGGPTLAIEFMENIQLFLIPDASVIFVGHKTLVEETLMSQALRNTINVLYLMLEDAEDDMRSSNPVILKKSHPIVIYARCLFCNNGYPGFQLVNSWKPTTGFLLKKPLLGDQFRDLQGYKMRVTQMGWFPLIGYTVDTKEVGSTVTPLDTLHVRMLKAVARAMNFTYEMRLPWDNQWGVSTPSGNWTGIIGTLQYHKADFGMSITYNVGRMKVVDFTRILLKEPVIMVMSKPRPPPPYLAIVYPFTGEVWAAVLVSCIVGGIFLWIVQLAWVGISGKKGLSLAMSFLYTIGGLLGVPATILPQNTSGLMTLNFWMIYCLLITVAYKSALTAHLSVPGKTKAIDSLEEMLREPGWTWGYADTHSGTYDLFKKSDSPVIKRVFEGMQIQPNEQQAERILIEKHVLIIKEFLFKSLKSAIARNRRGESPFYYGKSEYFANGDGWTFRQNAPFFDAIDMKLQQLLETGHIAYWLKQLIGTSPEDICNGSTCKRGSEPIPEDTASLESSGQVVLSLNHLQSAFYLLALGIAFAAIAFAGENIYCIIKQRKK